MTNDFTDSIELFRFNNLMNENLAKAENQKESGIILFI